MPQNPYAYTITKSTFIAIIWFAQVTHIRINPNDKQHFARKRARKTRRIDEEEKNTKKTQQRTNEEK